MIGKTYIHKHSYNIPIYDKSEQRNILVLIRIHLNVNSVMSSYNPRFKLIFLFY